MPSSADIGSQCTSVLAANELPDAASIQSESLRKSTWKIPALDTPTHQDLALQAQGETSRLQETLRPPSGEAQGTVEERDVGIESHNCLQHPGHLINEIEAGILNELKGIQRKALQSDKVRPCWKAVLMVEGDSVSCPLLPVSTMYLTLNLAHDWNLMRKSHETAGCKRKSIAGSCKDQLQSMST